ncbi:class I SAM-dependent methyltransferase, partial [Bacillus altitudinis]
FGVGNVGDYLTVVKEMRGVVKGGGMVVWVER